VRFEELLSVNPAKISGLSNQGQTVKAGAPANIVFYNPKASVTVESVSQSKSANNPYLGMTLSGSVTHTVFNGVLTVKNSMIQEIGTTNGN
jgi:dihydroorotase